MLTCAARPKQPGGDESLHQPEEVDRHDSASSKQAIKSLTTQAIPLSLSLSTLHIYTTHIWEPRVSQMFLA